MENVDINTKHQKTNFGDVWHINATDNTFRFALYRYDDEMDTIYLSNVFVKEESRGQGYGNTILNLAEEAAKKMDATTIWLKVKNGSFTYEWYKRHGYVDLTKDEEWPGYVWMRKRWIGNEDTDLYDMLPIETLSEEEFAEAKQIYQKEKNYSKVLKYINSKHPDLGLKLSKLYFELYIDNRK